MATQAKIANKRSNEKKANKKKANKKEIFCEVGEMKARGKWKIM